MNYQELPVFLTGKDVMIGLATSQATAYRRLNEVKEAKNIGKNKKVLVTTFCEYFGIPLEIFYQNFKT